MNRENKKKSFEKNYYKTHPCNESFVCKVCGKTVVPTGAGSDHRNHCPYCLSSQHLDNEPGDRAAECGGVMEPIHLIGVQADRAGSKTMRIRSLRNKQRQKGVYEGLHYTHK